MKRTRLSSDELRSLRTVPVSAERPNRVAVALAMLDLTQREVAAGTNLTPPTVSDIYNFKVLDVKLGTLRALAEFFGCTIDDIFPRIPAAVVDDQPVLPFKRHGGSVADGPRPAPVKELDPA